MLSVELRGFDEFSILVDGVEGLLAVDSDEVQDILDSSIALVLDSLRKTFLDSSDPDGTPWIPSKAGLAREASGGPGTGYDTGNLWRSIQLYSGPSDERIIGTDVLYGPYFQGKDSSLIRREFLTWTPGLVSQLEELVQRKTERLFRGL